MSEQMKPETSTLTMAEYVARYRKNHPEKAYQWRIASAVHLLEKEGYTVTPPASSTEGGKEE